MRVPNWVANLFADKPAPAEQPPPIIYNKATGLPSVSSTVEHHRWIASQSAPRIDQHSQDTWAGAAYRPSSAEQEAAARGHPAGSAWRSDEGRIQDRRAQRSYPAPYRPRFQPPTLWAPHPDAGRDHRDDPAPSWWRAGGGEGSGRQDSDLGHPPGCGCHWCGG